MKYNLDAIERAARNGGTSEGTRRKIARYQAFLETQRDHSNKAVEQCKRILEIKPTVFLRASYRLRQGRRAVQADSGD